MIPSPEKASHALDARRGDIAARERIRHSLKIAILNDHHHQLANIVFKPLIKDLLTPLFHGCV